MRSDDHYVDVAGQSLGLASRKRVSRGGGRNPRKVIVLILGAILAVGAGVVVTALSPPPAPPVLSAADVAQSRDNVQKLKNEFTAIHEDAQKRKPHPFKLSVTQADINTLLKTDADTLEMLASHGVDEAFAWIERGALRATARLPVAGVTVSVSASMVPTLEDGHIVFRVSSVSVGRLGIPSGAARAKAESIAAVLDARVFDPHIAYRSVEVKGNAITVTGDTT